ncbi:MAG: phosphatidate cytidylyltransferase [Lachnospiraceae bacterium]|nr:phosphatidate cytidylyltransferase [Lachnospiraceae bacterium]
MFIKRAISAISLLALIFFLFAIGGYPLAGVLLIISCVGYWELCKAFACKNALPGAERTPLPAKKSIDCFDIIGLITVVVYYVVMVFMKEPIYQFMVVVCFVIAILFAYVFCFPKFPIDRIAAVAFSFIYCPVMLSFIYMTRASEPYGKYLIWLILIGSWGCDTFAYLIGSAFGKRKIFPVLSPNKSLAGCIGGIAASAIIGGVYGYFYVMPGLKAMGNEKPYFFLVLAAISMVGGVIGMLGDLVASGIKRNKGFKDYAKLIPGHGGMMDRFDSMISTAPAIYVLSLLLILNNF